MKKLVLIVMLGLLSVCAFAQFNYKSLNNSDRGVMEDGEVESLHSFSRNKNFPHNAKDANFLPRKNRPERESKNMASRFARESAGWKKKTGIKTNIPPSSILFASQLKTYQEGLVGGRRYSADSSGRKEIDVLNAPIISIIRYAYRNKGEFSRNNTEIRTRDSASISSKLQGEAYTDWLRKGNGYIYQLRTPKEADIFGFMQADMKHYFPAYSTFIETQDKDCLVLERTGSAEKLKSNGGESKTEFTAFGCELQNWTLYPLTFQLGMRYLEHEGLPLVDNTGYTGRVDMKLVCKMTSVTELNKALEAYGLIIRRKKMPVKILVIADNPEYQKKEGAR